ncbi:GntR family transcriptional regulator [Ancylobacter sp. MQZ15Z-1]|uniref:GntR family transcriptional regulator n=1 Tax=Ancylobacter mangrovi TaxID=2972472 RepID=A0A9X2P9S1_9HYPH|nr:GntR family transcriptional regulator [Ancylobacter mangrovi]MCS0494666.1 GntR family transcriptional regulator [Ancylobacter mangrovi]
MDSLSARPGSSRRSTALNDLARRIADHIRESNLPSGAHISAQDLASRFSASRTPINRALRLLETRNILVHHTNRGFFVASGDSAHTEADDSINELERIYTAILTDRIRDNIPNVVLESHLINRYNISASQLSMVLSRIAKEGWIERRGGYGWEFTEYLTTPEALAQTFRVRQALEPASLLEPGYELDLDRAAYCRLVEQNMLAGDIQSMSPEALFMRGVRFHETIVAGSKNPFMIETIQKMNRLRRLLAYYATEQRRAYHQHCYEHLELLDLLEAGKHRQAADALRLHLQNVEANYERIRAVLTK